MELGLLFLAVVVFSWWCDNLYEFVPTKHTEISFGLSTAKFEVCRGRHCDVGGLTVLHSVGAFKQDMT